MALTNQDIDLFYLEVLARHATQAEQATFAALSNSESSAQIRADIATLPEATTFVDPVIRLYQGAFGRAPDTADPQGDTVAAFDTGATSGYWANVNAYRSGISLLALAEAFTHSQEFIHLYGSSNVTAALITAYYQHILGRDPASTEVSAWLNAKDPVTHQPLDAAQILLGFTQSAEYISRSQASIDTFKTNLAAGIHAGALVIPSDYTLTSDHDAAGSVDEGHTITYTLKGPAGDAGNTFAYNFSGSAATLADISGPLSGTVTLDSTGTATITVTVLSDNVTEGSESLVLNIPGLGADGTDQLTINDTSITPVVQNFTPGTPETLAGTDGADTFVGVVDRSLGFDNSTLSNIVDVANGGKGVDTEHVFVLSNILGSSITPTANSVEIFQVTDRIGSTFDMRFVPDVTKIEELNSDSSTTFNNVQNLVDIALTSPQGNGVDMTVRVANTVESGVVGIELTDTGVPGNGSVNINYSKQNGSDVASGFAIDVTGQNQNVNLFNTTLASAITVSGFDSTATLDLDLNDNSNGLGALSSIDATNYEGALTMTNIGFVAGSALQNDLDVKGAQGNNTFTIRDANNKAVTVATNEGTDTVTVVNQGTGTVKVSTGNGDQDTVVVNAGGSPSGSVDVTVGNGNGDTVTVNAGTNTAPTAATITVNMGSGTGDTATITAGAFHALNLVAAGAKATVTSNAGSDSVQNVTANGGDATIFVNAGANSSVTVEATGTGGAPFQAAAFNASPLGGLFNQNVTVQVGGANSPVNITTGAGADAILVNDLTVGNNNVTVKAGAGDDRVSLFLNANQLHTGVSLDGGDGTDTLAVAAIVAHGGLNGASVTNFEALELTTVLGGVANGGVVVSDFGPINHVVLDNGFTTGADLVGLNSGAEIDLFGVSTNQTLQIEITGANIHTDDVVNIDLHNANNNNQNFGIVNVQSVETVNITSEGVGVLNNVMQLSNIQGSSAQAIHVLNIDGDNGLSLSGTVLQDLRFVTEVNAGNHTGGLNIALNGNNQDVKITTGSGADTITGLGNGDHQIDTGAGDDVINTGGGTTTVHAGTGNDTINSGGAIVNSVYLAANESIFGSGDTINAFLVANDKIDLSAIVNGGTFVFAGNFSAAGASSAINGDIAGAVTAVYDTTNHNILIDVNGDHILDAAHDMQIHLTGIAAINSTNFVV